MKIFFALLLWTISIVEVRAQTGWLAFSSPGGWVGGSGYADGPLSVPIWGQCSDGTYVWNVGTYSQVGWLNCAWVAYGSAWGEPDFGSNAVMVGGEIKNWLEMPFWDIDHGYHNVYLVRYGNC